MHQLRGRMGVINLIMRCMSKLSTLYHCTKARICAKKMPETLDIITQVWYNKHVVKGTPQI